jgi:hypothetical protein
MSHPTDPLQLPNFALAGLPFCRLAVLLLFVSPDARLPAS